MFKNSVTGVKYQVADSYCGLTTSLVLGKKQACGSNGARSTCLCQPGFKYEYVGGVSKCTLNLSSFMSMARPAPSGWGSNCYTDGGAWFTWQGVYNNGNIYKLIAIPWGFGTTSTSGKCAGLRSVFYYINGTKLQTTYREIKYAGSCLPDGGRLNITPYLINGRNSITTLGFMHIVCFSHFRGVLPVCSM